MFGTKLDTDNAAVSAPPTREEKITVANALQVVRPVTGDLTGVGLFRLLRLVALEDILGRGAKGTAYIAGKKTGKALGITDLDAFLELCKVLRIGQIKVPVLTASKARIDVYECVTCAGMTPVGRTLCHFEAGLMAGVVEVVMKKPVKGQEVTCIGGLGHDACGVDLLIG